MLDAKNRKKIVFSADDFGVSAEATSNILELARLGKLDRVEIMINDQLKKTDALELKKTGVKLDIHLHLIDYHSDYWRGNRNLNRGALERIVIFIVRLFGKNSSKKVAKYWEDQIENFKEIFGEYPSGAGSHEHIHYFTPYFKIMLSLCEKYQIGYIRFGTENFNHPSLIGKIINWLRRKDLKYFQETKFKTSEYMLSFDWFDNLKFLSQLAEEKQAEVVFHPERINEMLFLKNL